MRPTLDGRDTRNARGRATVRAIEREAVRLALENGAAALTVDQICEAVGISQRSFFNHFDAKEDALLGWELPRISEERTRAYLADPGVGILTGAMSLVELPREFLDDPELAFSRFRLLSTSPSLSQRQAARLRPLAQAVGEIVLLKLQAIGGPDADPAILRASAATITIMAASLVARPSLDLERPRVPQPERVAGALDDLRWVWDRLI